MFRQPSRLHPQSTRRPRRLGEPGDVAETPLESTTKAGDFTGNLAADTRMLQGWLEHCHDVTTREVLTAPPLSRRARLFFIDGLVDAQALQEGVIKPLQTQTPEGLGKGLKQRLAALPEHEMGAGDLAENTEALNVIEGVMRGQVAVLIDGLAEAILVDVAQPKGRQVAESRVERLVRGPREAFVENLQVSLSLVRRRLPIPDLKVQLQTLGARTHTKVAVLYLESVANRKLVDEVLHRLEKVDIDGILDTGYLEEFIEDSPFSPFPQVEHTERPDKVTAGLLAGRVAVFCDGSPMALMVPCVLWNYLQASEDFYERSLTATGLRLVRALGLVLALLLPSLYVALTTFHQEVLPTNLVITIAAQREGIPFPALVEALMMELIFEILREAGLRLPQAVGQTVSIVGALVIGQAAIDAGLASPAMVMVVALTAIANFTLPGYNFAFSLRLLRFLIILAAGALGLYGILMAASGIVLHLLALRSFGVPYLAPVAPFTLEDVKDTIVRAPWWAIRLRPLIYRVRQLRRQGRDGRPQPPPPGNPGGGDRRGS